MLCLPKFFRKRKKINPKYKYHYLVRTTGLKKTFSKSDTTNWSYSLYKIIEIVSDTIASYHIDKIPKRFNEVVMKKTELSMKESDSVMKPLKLN